MNIHCAVQPFKRGGGGCFKEIVPTSMVQYFLSDNHHRYCVVVAMKSATVIATRESFLRELFAQKRRNRIPTLTHQNLSPTMTTALSATKSLQHRAAAAAAASSSCYVACNIYISAGREKGHGAILMHLLRHAQRACQRQRKGSKGTRCAVVGVLHAFTDQVYNRSSFHLVGLADPLSVIAADLGREALACLRPTVKTQQDDDAPHHHHHPFVGYVDHVSIMPLEGVDILQTNSNENETFQPSTPSGMAARHVGRVLEEAGVQVYYYGSAHPQGASLATIRREKTQFFKSGGLADTSSGQSSPSTAVEVATVGAPLSFVENYNIRLKATCSKKTAQSLTKRVRERDGGLPGVEALTLPYSNGRWEVACNLLQPEIGSTAEIDKIVNIWEREVGENYVDTAYRVGTTAEQSLNAITNFDCTAWLEYDSKVEDRLRSYLS